MRRYARFLAPAPAAAAFPLALAAGFLAAPAASATEPVDRTDVPALEALSLRLADELAAHRGPLYRDLRSRTTGPMGALNANADLMLMFLDDRGMPRFYTVTNVNAAKTVSTDDVQPGGSGGFGLTGSGTTLGELCIWDAGGVRESHQEFGGRVTQGDADFGTSGHATHTSGTMIAAGVDAAAKGMSYEANLLAFDWDEDFVEMAARAALGMNASNHSYTYITGWIFGFDQSEWYWFGDETVSSSEDYGFGFYDDFARTLDEIAHDAPHYTICFAAANDRGQGPNSQPLGHYDWDPNLEDWVWDTDVHEKDGGADGYDCIPWLANSKNCMTIGAVNDIPSGWTQVSDVVMTSFSGWGPTDDGRVKPDFVANGTSLYSSTSSSDASYGTASGTSMATPNFCGSINLLYEHYQSLHGGQRMLSSTVKALCMNTADEAGEIGPDYVFGWGLLNTLHAAEAIEADDVDGRRIREDELADGETDVWELDHTGGPLRVSLAWNDPPGTPPSPALNPTTPMLVNDLDLRVEDVALRATYQPWVLNPASPGSAATTGDNVLDNCEQVRLASAPAGTYLVTVSHKGSLASPQAYSLVTTGATIPHVKTAAPTPAAGGATRLAGASPNPFNPLTTISFELARDASVLLTIHDVAGRLVRSLAAGETWSAGGHSVRWDGTDAGGRPVASGVYLARLQADGVTDVVRMALLR